MCPDGGGDERRWKADALCRSRLFGDVEDRFSSSGVW
jgi:hypothetical protein